MDALPPPTPAAIESGANEQPFEQPYAPPVRRWVRPAMEVGAGTFMMTGVATEVVVGPSAFVEMKLNRTAWLRIAAAAGESTGAQAHVAWGAGRADLCETSEGNYPTGKGLWLEVCGGLDVGVTYLAVPPPPTPTVPSQTLPYLGLGPNVGLGGELGRRSAVVLRGILDANVIRQDFVDSSGATRSPSLVAARVELQLTFKL